MSSDPSTVRAMLVLLEQRGLVERDTHPTDARERAVGFVTDEQGQPRYERIAAAAAAVVLLVVIVVVRRRGRS